MKRTRINKKVHLYIYDASYVNSETSIIHTRRTRTRGMNTHVKKTDRTHTQRDTGHKESDMTHGINIDFL